MGENIHKVKWSGLRRLSYSCYFVSLESVFFSALNCAGLENWKDFILSVTDRLVVALLLYRLFVRPIHTAGWQGTSLRGTGSENNRVCQLNVGAQRGIQRSGEKYGQDT